MNDSDPLRNLFASRSPEFYLSPEFQNAVDPIVRPGVRGFAKGLVIGHFGPRHPAANDFAYDEITNQALFKCYRGLRGYEICRADNAIGRLLIFRKFLYTIARNCVREYARRERTRVEVAADVRQIQALADQRVIDASDAPLPESLRQFPQLRALLSELSPDDERLLYLVHVAKFSWLQIETYFNGRYSQARLKVHAARLLNRLRRRILAAQDISRVRSDNNG